MEWMVRTSSAIEVDEAHRSDANTHEEIEKDISSLSQSPPCVIHHRQRMYASKAIT